MGFTLSASCTVVGKGSSARGSVALRRSNARMSSTVASSTIHKARNGLASGNANGVVLLCAATAANNNDSTGGAEVLVLMIVLLLLLLLLSVDSDLRDVGCGVGSCCCKNRCKAATNTSNE